MSISGDGKHEARFWSIEGERIRCRLCPHNCSISPLRRGICGVRENRDGKLYSMNYGKVSSINVDPIEKKPLFHFYPGEEVFSLGSVGCNFRCRHCFVPGTFVVTSRGAHRIEEISGIDKDELLTHSGRFMKIKDVFDHHYAGQVCRVRPTCLPEIVCTPEHQFLASVRPSSDHIHKVEARDLRDDHFVVIPKRRWACETQNIERRSANGHGPDRSSRGHHDASFDTGIDPRLTRLLGLFCAKGHVDDVPGRAGLQNAVISFTDSESGLAEETGTACHDLFGDNVSVVKEGRSLRARVGGTAIVRMFKEQCGADSMTMKVPDFLFNSSAELVGLFLQGYFDGNGGHKKDRSEAHTVSKPLAMGICELLINQGVVPTFDRRDLPGQRPTDCGKMGRCTEYIVSVPPEFDFVRGRWKSKYRSFYHEDENNYFIPVRSVSEENYEGKVYNFEVEGDHTYTANFAAVCNCQNYNISMASLSEFGLRDMRPEEVSEMALSNGCRGIAFTYNEPTIWHEFAYDAMGLAKEKGMFTVYVTNGYIQEEPLRELSERLDAMNIDVKGFGQRFYDKICLASLQPVLDTVTLAHELGIHIELTYLIIPGENDQKEEMRKFSEWVADLDPRIPVHFTRFHPDFKMADKPPTPIPTMEMARDVGREAGLQFVYLGNVALPHGEDTFCPKCHRLMVERRRFGVMKVEAQNGRCPNCGQDLYMVQRGDGEARPEERG